MYTYPHVISSGMMYYIFNITFILHYAWIENIYPQSSFQNGNKDRIMLLLSNIQLSFRYINEHFISIERMIYIFHSCSVKSNIVKHMITNLIRIWEQVVWNLMLDKNSLDYIFKFIVLISPPLWIMYLCAIYHHK